MRVGLKTAKNGWAAAGRLRQWARLPISSHAVSGGVLPDLRMLTPEKHDQFVGILHGARIPDGMPSFAEAFDREQMEQIHQYLIKRAHDRIEHGPNDLPQPTQKNASN